jgi:SAM-dependent methyltransferase
MPDEPLSRRGLFSLGWARQPAGRAPRSAVDPYKADLHARWAAGAGPLLDAWAPLAGALCDVLALEPDFELLDVAAGHGAVSAEAARRGATVTACDPVPALVEAGRVRTEAERLDVLWEVGDPEALPFADWSFDAAVSLYGAAFAPRPRRTVRELLRVLTFDGLLAMAVPASGSFLDATLALAGPPPAGIPAANLWGRDGVARERIEAVAPGTEMETRELPYTLAFASEAAAWDACAGPLGLSDAVREDFADMIVARSQGRGEVRISERALLVLARRGA